MQCVAHVRVYRGLFNRARCTAAFLLLRSLLWAIYPWQQHSRRWFFLSAGPPKRTKRYNRAEEAKRREDAFENAALARKLSRAYGVAEASGYAVLGGQTLAYSKLLDLVN